MRTPQGEYPPARQTGSVDHEAKTRTGSTTFGCNGQYVGILAVQGVFSGCFAGVVTLILRLFAWHFFKS